MAFQEYRHLRQVVQEYGQEDEPMGGTNQDYAQEHPEVEDEEDLRLGEGEHHDAGELGERDAAKDVAAHLYQRRGDLLLCGHVAHGVGVHYMAAEFYGYAHTLKKIHLIYIYDNFFKILIFF